MNWLLARYLRHTLGDEVWNRFLLAGSALLLLWMGVVVVVDPANMKPHYSAPEGWEPNPELLRKLEEMK